MISINLLSVFQLGTMGIIGRNNLAFKSESQNRCCQTQTHFWVTSQEILLLVVAVVNSLAGFSLFSLWLLCNSRCSLVIAIWQIALHKAKVAGSFHGNMFMAVRCPHRSVFFSLQSLCADCGNCLQLRQMFEILQGCTGWNLSYAVESHRKSCIVVVLGRHNGMLNTYVWHIVKAWASKMLSFLCFFVAALVASMPWALCFWPLCDWNIEAEEK